MCLTGNLVLLTTFDEFEPDLGRAEIARDFIDAFGSVDHRKGAKAIGAGHRYHVGTIFDPYGGLRRLADSWPRWELDENPLDSGEEILRTVAPLWEKRACPGAR